MKRTFLYGVPLIISSFLVFIAHNNELWMIFWGYSKIPAQTIPFGDLEFILRATDLKEAGFNPYLENPMNIRYVYPSIWLGFFKFFSLNDLLNFRIFNFLIIYVYTYIYLDLVFKYKNNYLTIILLILFFSTANLLALERLNIEIIIFILIYLLALSKSNFLRIPIFILAIYCKIYPIFTIFIFSRNKLIFFSMISISLLILFNMRSEIFFLMEHGNEVALNIAYGIPTLIKGMWYYSMKLGYLINNENFKYFKYSMIFLVSVYASILILINFKFGEKKISNNFDFDEKLFICGAGIFIARFICFSNVDYSLIFLVFTIPYIIKIEAQNLKTILILSLVLIFYSQFFEGGNRYTMLYFTKGIFIHTFKIIVFSLMCFYFGKILNRHLKL
jgi:hypothetical protein